jgi:ComF family protein
MAAGVLKRLLRPVSELFFPPACAACGKEAELLRGICAECWSGLARIPTPQCARCGRHIPSEAIDGELPDYQCGQCRVRSRIPWIRLRSLYRYQSPLREIIHQFKFYGLEGIGVELAERFAANAMELAVTTEIDAVVPVPTHPWRLLERGFNPAAVFARAAARALEIPCLEGALRKLRQTPPQSRLDPDDRRRNLRDVFATRDELIRGKRLLLVDDVITTGATVDECARALGRGGAREVGVITLARADHY